MKMTSENFEECTVPESTTSKEKVQSRIEEDSTSSHCSRKASLGKFKPEDFPICPIISTPETEITHDKIRTVHCRQIPGSPDMSPVTRRRRTALAKKAMELEKDGKMTRLRVVGSASVVLEFREKDNDCDMDLGPSSNSGDSCSAAQSWQRYRSPAMSRRRMQTNAVN